MTMTASLQQMIEASGITGRIVISDEAALELSAELAHGFNPPITEAEIYQSILNGDSEFMGRPLLVSDE